MTNLKDQINAEIQHHISPLIGWLRRDASIGKVDHEGERLAQWDDRSERAAKAIAELVGDEYEYNIESLDLITGHTSLYRDFWEPNTEWLQRKLDDRNTGGSPEYSHRLVKRRKAGKVEDV